jgi:hypothetical protein
MFVRAIIYAAISSSSIPTERTPSPENNFGLTVVCSDQQSSRITQPLLRLRPFNGAFSRSRRLLHRKYQLQAEQESSSSGAFPAIGLLEMHPQGEQNLDGSQYQTTLEKATEVKYKPSKLL